jgi:hypothetical protein
VRGGGAGLQWLFEEKAESAGGDGKTAFLQIASEIKEYIGLIQEAGVGPNALIQDGRIVDARYNFER